MDILKTFQALEDNLVSNNDEIELLKKKKIEEQQRQAELQRQEAERTRQLQQQAAIEQTRLQQQKAAQEYQLRQQEIALQRQKAQQEAELQKQKLQQEAELQKQIADRVKYKNSIQSYISTVYSNFAKAEKIFLAKKKQKTEEAYDYYCGECEKYEQWEKYKSDKDIFQNPGDEYCTDREYYDTPLARLSARISNNKRVALKENLHQVEKNIEKRYFAYDARDNMLKALQKPLKIGLPSEAEHIMENAIADAHYKAPEPCIRMESLFYIDGHDLQLKDKSAELFAEIDVEIYVLRQSRTPKIEMSGTIKVLTEMIQEIKESRRIINDTKNKQDDITLFDMMKDYNLMAKTQDMTNVIKDMEEENKKKVEEINRIIGII